MGRRYRRAAEKDPIYQKMGETVFLSMKYAFLIATFVGYKNQKREEFASGISFGPAIVTDEDEQLLNALILADTDDLSLITEPDTSESKRNKIIEEYANAGISILNHELFEKPGNPLDNLVDYIFCNFDKDEKVNLESLDSIL